MNLPVLMVNGLTLSLALGFLLIVLWYDFRKIINQFFAIFLILIAIWNAGYFFVQLGILTDTEFPIKNVILGIAEIGFAGSSVAVYALTTILIGLHPRYFRHLVLLGLLFVIGYNVLLIVINSNAVFSQQDLITPSNYQLQPLSTLFYIIFDTSSLYLTWRYRRKMQSLGLVLGIIIFTLGQGLSLLNAELGIVTISTSISAVGALIVSFSIVQKALITPLKERISQVEAMHSVSLAITSRLDINEILNEITRQATEWLGTDAAAIFLSKDSQLHLAAVTNLPNRLVNTQINFGDGVAGSVAVTRSTIHLENYSRDWTGTPDFYLANETFGSVICAPLISNHEVIGALMVIASKQGRLLTNNEVDLLEQLGAQTAIAISQRQLFDQQMTLAEQLKTAFEQLETVLVSTNNPVIAVNRQLHIIFANPAAMNLFSTTINPTGHFILDLLPDSSLPTNYRSVIHDIRKNGRHIYEITLDEQVYLCHLTNLGEKRIEGWVAVLNDVTHLIELDRMKSEMIRMTSHDLKNPLQAAMANLELLQDDLADHSNQDVSLSLHMIDKQLSKMNRIIGGILDLERAESARSETEIFLVTEAIDNAVEEVEDYADAEDIDIIVELAQRSGSIEGNIEQFERAIINLLENAIKFTPNGGKVWVLLTSDKQRLIIEVKDEGVGIPKKIQSKVFNRFFRGQQVEIQHVSGTGLGLSLVKAVIENHDGTVWVRSEEGQGSSFFISLPYSDI